MSDEQLLQAVLSCWSPPPRLSLSEWADQFAVLSAESSAESGKWTTLPYQREIMDSFTTPGIDTVVWMKSARVGATKIFNHLIGYHVCQDPAAVMVVQPTVEDAEGFSKDEMAPMLRDTPALRNLTTDPKAKDSANTILLKQFHTGAVLQMVGANSPRGFRRVSRRVVLFDEVDAYPATTTEGDQIKLGIKRSEYFWNRKIGIVSTPTVKGASRIERWFRLGDQRYYFVPCPFCDHRQQLRWAQVKWEKGRPETAAYECENCGERIAHTRKGWMVENGEWRATAEMSRPGIRSYHISALYSYSPNASWEQLVREFLEVKQDRDQLQTFVNTILGECFEDEAAAKVDADVLMARIGRERCHPAGQVPDGAMLLLMAVDVQDTWLEVSVWGYGQGEEAWRIWHQRIDGDPSGDEVWQVVTTIRETEWPTAGCGKRRVFLCGVDTGGHYTGEAYNYCRVHAADGVVALKGGSVPGKPPIGRGNKVDVTWRGKTIRRGVTLYSVGVDGIKETVYARLRCQKPGPGYIWFDDETTLEYLQGLTAERQVVKYEKGFPRRKWECPGGRRNEPLDLKVYCLALLHLSYRRFNRATMWEQLAKGTTGSSVIQRKAAENPVTQVEKAIVSGGVQRKRGRWLG